MTSFFSLQIKSSVTFTPESQSVLHLTNIALDPSETIKGNTSLYIKSKEYNGIIGTLNNNLLSSTIDILLPGGVLVELENKGNNSVTVIGWKQPYDDENDMDMMDEDEVDSEEYVLIYIYW